MIRFLHWLEKRQILSESVLLLEKEDIEVVKQQVNGMFDDFIRSLLETGKIAVPHHVSQAKNILSDGHDWWFSLVQVMRQYPYKSQDLYDAAIHLASDLWEHVFDPNKYDDRNPPLVVFHRMATIRGQDIAFRFFGWRRKLKTTSVSDIGSFDNPQEDFPEIEWKELMQKLIQSIENIASKERNTDRAKRAIDVMFVKLTGFSKIYNKHVSESGLDSLAAFYHVARREMYDTLLMIYKAVKDVANVYDADNLLDKVLKQLPASLKTDPEKVVLNLMPQSPKEITHSELFSKVYSFNRELKSLEFKQIIQNLADRNQINIRKDNKSGKHQTLYSLP